MTAAEHKRLVRLGVTLEAVTVILEIIERVTQGRDGSPAAMPLTPAQRARKYRVKHRAEPVTAPVTVAVTNGDGRHDTVTPSPTPPLSQSSLTVSKEVSKKEGKTVVVARDGEVEAFVARWNSFADYCNGHGLMAKDRRLSKVEAVPEKRRRAIKAVLKDFKMDQIVTALNRVRQCPGLLGRNDRGWVANVTWLLRPDTITKIMEGNYDHWTPTLTPKQRTSAEFDVAIEEQYQFLVRRDAQGAGDPGPPESFDGSDPGPGNGRLGGGRPGAHRLPVDRG